MTARSTEPLARGRSPRPLTMSVGPQRWSYSSSRRRSCSGDVRILQEPEGAIPEAHARGLHRDAIVNLVEVEAWVPRVLRVTSA